MKNLKLVCCIFLLLLGGKLSAKVILPSLISDGIVLQRDIKIPIWGWADNGEEVTVSFNGKTYVAKTGIDKKWKVMLNPVKAGGPFEMKIVGTNTITVKNILIGDVWLCSGQSNMEYELYKSAEKYSKEIAASTNDQIRHFQVKRRIGFNTSNDIESVNGWQAASPTTVPNFTAVGYFFAKDLYEKYKVPIGIINSSFGGTPAEAWMNENALKDFPNYYANAMKYKDTALVDKITAQDKEMVDSWYKQVNDGDIGTKEKWYENNYNSLDWKTIQMPAFWQDKGLSDAGVVWFKKEINIDAADLGKNAILKLGNIIQRDITYFNGVMVGTTGNKYLDRNYIIEAKLLKVGKNVIIVRVLNEGGDAGFIKDKPYQLELNSKNIDLKGDWQYKLSNSSKPLQRGGMTTFQREPTAMYHGMLEPLVGYAIKGVIWYQGESNIGRNQEYHQLFSGLITQWREEWAQGDFPFLFVQLANNNPPKKEPSESSLAALQEAQQQTLALPNTGMAVANDIGEWNDVHPKNKLDVGKRLALVAQKVAYGDEKVVYSGPVYQSMKIKKNKIILSFSNIGSGLMAKNEGELKYFSIAGANKKFVWAKAKISKNTITVWNENISSPVAVRYAWADNPEGANLYNKEGLPASAFRTEK
ncbi:sialate O-acetylesterase [Pedobacter cryophilus]|uniref:Sialate O-acetylesterase n=1 Tax=Pedobacter cryophilus TaxID=2571271 RepID=A0A4U1C308_9SPHI|nr:sialate O-acetylesterase [Pedobacter cryophilus]TKB98686.1 sialate O-acetylesterase [Pedobacter cryophilus]